MSDTYDEFQAFLTAKGQIAGEVKAPPVSEVLSIHAQEPSKEFDVSKLDEATVAQLERELELLVDEEDKSEKKPHTESKLHATGAKQPVPMQMGSFAQVFNISRLQNANYKVSKDRRGHDENEASSSGREQKGTARGAQRKTGANSGSGSRGSGGGGEGSGGRKFTGFGGKSSGFRDTRPLPLPFELDTPDDIDDVRMFMRLIAGESNIDESRIWTDFDEEERLRKLNQAERSGNDEEDYLNQLQAQDEHDDRSTVVKKGGIYIFPLALSAISTAEKDVKTWTSTATTTQEMIRDPELKVPFATLVATKMAHTKFMAPQQYYQSSLAAQIAAKRESTLDLILEILVSKGKAVNFEVERGIYFTTDGNPGWW